MNMPSRQRQDASRWLGTTLASRYRVDGVLGEGGMGLVLAAHHLSLAQAVAIKVSHEPDDATARGRFLREARLAARIRSEHAARILDAGTLDSGELFLVMERLEGSTLREHLKQRGPLPVAETIDLVIQACDAVAEAHSLGIVHRDLKPSNLFLARRADGSPLVKVLDFGIAKEITSLDEADLTDTTDVIGSPHYLSPEQLRGARRVTPRSDVWALGVVLYELLSGQRPFRGHTRPEIYMDIGTAQEPPLGDLRADLPEGLVELIHRCLAKDAALRPPSVAALAASLLPFAPLASLQLIVERVGKLPEAPLGTSSESLVAVTPSSPSLDLEQTVSSWSHTPAKPAPAAPPSSSPVIALDPSPGASSSRPDVAPVSSVPARRPAALLALPLVVLGALAIFRLGVASGPAPGVTVSAAASPAPLPVVASQAPGTAATEVISAPSARPAVTASAPALAASAARAAEPRRNVARPVPASDPGAKAAASGHDALFLPTWRR